MSRKPRFEADLTLFGPIPPLTLYFKEPDLTNPEHNTKKTQASC